MIFKSIKWRLQAWHGFLLVCLVSGLLSGFYIFERREKLQALDNQLGEAMTFLLPRYAPPNAPGPAGRQPGGMGPALRGPEDRPPFREPNEFPPPGREFQPPDGPRDVEAPSQGSRDVEERFFGLGKLYYVAWARSGERVAASSNAPVDIPHSKPSSPTRGRVVRDRGEVREMIQTVPTGRVILVGTPLEPMSRHLNNLALALVLIGVGIVVVGFTVGWWLASRALRPIAEISGTAQEIAAGDLSRRINTSETESELGQLAAVLNSTFARLDAAFAQQRQFTSDAAHELRTPVSVILTQTQSTLNKERSGAEYRETLEACQRAATRMKKLVESLLELARLDAGKATGKCEPVDLAQCAEECVALIRPLAEERNIQLQTELGAATCLGDGDQLALVVSNLLTNAVHYNRDGGEVRINTRMENGAATVTVSDTGAGIASEHLPYIFDRFYRADTARTSSQGRTGLGLAITKAIVESHGGKIEVTSTPGEGTSFVVGLPK